METLSDNLCMFLFDFAVLLLFFLTTFYILQETAC